MEQKVQAREWAKLKLVGRPLMTSRDLWVAVRPLPRLLHLYYDSNLRALLRFPQDPIFLLFAPSGEEGKHVKVSMSASLLVITSDGCLWRISHINSHGSIDRPAKRLKQNLSREPEAKFKKGTEDDWDIFEDCDIYKDTDLYPSHDVLTGSELAWAGSTKTHMLCKLLNSHASENAFRKVRVRCVEPETLVGKFPGACLAAAGPDNLIAVASYSRSPVLLTGGASLLSTDITPAHGTSSSNDCHSNRKTTPSCLLFATMKNSKHRSQWGAVTLSPKLFNAFSQGFVGARPKHLLLQGNSAGEVHVFPIDYPNPITSSMVLCDLQEPISELIAFPLDEDSDALLVLSSHGCLIAITASKSKCTSTPFLTSVSEFSLWKLFRIDVKDAFEVHSWRVKAPVVSATLYGSEHLCFCSASSVFIVSILENVDGKPPQKSSYAASTRATSSTSEEVVSLVCKTIPIHDIFVALAGQGLFVPTTKTRSLVGLTSRGRLVALRISDDILVAQKDCFIMKAQVKSWKPRVEERDENVMVLLDEIAAIESCAEALQVMKKSIDLAISELAIALRLTYDVLSRRDRYTARAPHRSLAVPLMTGLHCDLEVNPVMHTVALKRLCFSPGLNTQTSKSCHGYAEDVKLCLKVTLSNRGPYPVSSYWALLLDIQGLKEASSTTKMYFSSIINDGYGLAPGASSAMSFQISCVEESLNPFKASVYLCHIEENHDDVLQASPTSMKYLLQPVEALSRNAAKNGKTHASSRAACVLLARYQVDILSLLRPPRRLQHYSDFHSSHFFCPRGMGADAENHGTRPFLVKFQLSCTRGSDLPTWTKLNAVEKWKEIRLEDLIKCCALSKDGEELSGTDMHGNTMLLTLDNKQLGREGLFSREIQISAPTALMGCMVREAVLWRLKQHFGFQKTVEPSQNTDHILSLLVNTQKELDLVVQDTMNLDSLWCANHLQQSDVAAQSVAEAYTIFKHILDMYMSYRENDASNPFWRCVCHSRSM